MNYEDMTKAELIAALKLLQSTGTAEGHIIGYIGIAQDITTRGQAEKALEEGGEQSERCGSWLSGRGSRLYHETLSD